MQYKIHEFDRLRVWELVPPPDCVMIIALKWIYKVKLDEYGDVLKNKVRLWPTDIDKRMVMISKNHLHQLYVSGLLESSSLILPAKTCLPNGCQDSISEWQTKGRSNMLTYEAKTGAYSFQLDETRFVLDANLLRDAFEITPINQAYQFVSPPSSDAIMDFVNELGYTEVIHFVSRIAEKFIQSIQTFLIAKANLGSPTKKGKKHKPHVISYFRFTKLIICHLGIIHNIHQRSTSSFHLAEEDLRLGNLKFVPKGEADEVFGMPIPKELISNNIRNAPYYIAYLEMVAKHNQKLAAEKEGKKNPRTAKQPKPKPTKEKSSKPTHEPKPKLVDEPDEEPAQHDPELEFKYEGEGEDQDVEQVIQMSLESFQAHVGGVAIREPFAEASRPLLMVKGKGKAIATYEQTNSRGDTEILQIGEDQGKDVDDQVNSEEKTTKLDQGQARLNPGKTPESRPPQEQEFMKEDQVGPDPEASPDEHVILEEPLSSSETLSSIKSLDDSYIIGDLFLNDKPSKDELGKLNVDLEVVSMVTVPIHQASYKSLPEHVALYKSLEESMKWENRDEFLDEKDKSRKGRRDDQDPPLATQIQIQAEENTCSSRQKSASHPEQPIKDVPITDNVNISDSEDTNTAHLPKLKTRPD
nr:retrovirus-related Pol polyprotein from transposon TNT 1-94 [Tanacetum cinerariifolium]